MNLNDISRFSNVLVAAVLSVALVLAAFLFSEVLRTHWTMDAELKKTQLLGEAVQGCVEESQVIMTNELGAGEEVPNEEAYKRCLRDKGY